MSAPMVSVSGRCAGSSPRSNPDLAGSDGHDRTVLKLGSVTTQCFTTGSALLTRRNPDQADDSGMRLAHDNSPFAEVLVKGYQNPPGIASVAHDFTIARVYLPGTGPDHIVALLLQDFYRAAPYASVQEDLHASIQAALGSTRS